MFFGVNGHAHLDMVSIDLGHLFGPLSKIEMVQLVKLNWALDRPFDSSTKCNSTNLKDKYNIRTPAGVGV